jgi:uncharacterized protein (TIGR03435 family)
MTGGPGTDSPGQFSALGVSLKTLLFRRAYNLKEYQFSALPWMQGATVDVVAKVPAGTSPDQFRVMLQNLLIERFQIVLHHEQREMVSYDLVVAKGGIKMKPSRFDASTPPQPPGSSKLMGHDAEGFPVIPDTLGPLTTAEVVHGQIVMVTNRRSMQELVDTLTSSLNIPIVDKTALPGWFAYTLHFAPEGATGPELDAAPSLINALPSQLGLKLEPHKRQVDVLVIDKGLKTPIEN